MSTQAKKIIWALGLLSVVIAMGVLGKAESADQQEWLTAYCTDAAIWAAEEARGIPVSDRTGQPDYKGIAAESCPGMRPAGPAPVSRQGILDNSTSQPLVQF